MGLKEIWALVGALSMVVVMPVLADDSGGQSSDQGGMSEDQQGGTYGEEEGGTTSHGTMGEDQSMGGSVDPSELSKQDIKKVQKNLNAKGYDAGPVDGVWSSKVSQAIQRFQSDQGMPASGQLDHSTLSALNLSLATSESERAPASKKDKSKKSKKKKPSASPSVEAAPDTSGTGGAH